MVPAVKQEFDDYLKCGRLEHGFVRVKCDDAPRQPLGPEHVYQAMDTATGGPVAEGIVNAG